MPSGDWDDPLHNLILGWEIIIRLDPFEYVIAREQINLTIYGPSTFPAPQHEGT